MWTVKFEDCIKVKAFDEAHWVDVVTVVEIGSDSKVVDGVRLDDKIVDKVYGEGKFVEKVDSYGKVVDEFKFETGVGLSIFSFSLKL